MEYNLALESHTLKSEVSQHRLLFQRTEWNNLVTIILVAPRRVLTSASNVSSSPNEDPKYLK